MVLERFNKMLNKPHRWFGSSRQELKPAAIQLYWGRVLIRNQNTDISHCCTQSLKSPSLFVSKKQTNKKKRRVLTPTMSWIQVDTLSVSVFDFRDRLLKLEQIHHYFSFNWLHILIRSLVVAPARQCLLLHCRLSHFHSDCIASSVRLITESPWIYPLIQKPLQFSASLPFSPCWIFFFLAVSFIPAEEKSEKKSTLACPFTVCSSEHTCVHWNKCGGDIGNRCEETKIKISEVISLVKWGLEGCSTPLIPYIAELSAACTEAHLGQRGTPKTEVKRLMIKCPHGCC